MAQINACRHLLWDGNRECGARFEHASKKHKNHTTVAYCENHIKEYRSHVLESIILHPLGCGGVDVVSVYYHYDDDEDIEEFLNGLQADVRLDYHGVLDTIEKDEMLVPKPLGEKSRVRVCCVSYVGKTTTTRIEVREDIKKRILSGQIDFGILCFSRATRRHTEEEKNSFVDPYSKAWVNNFLSHSSPDLKGKVLFVDDSLDHVNSVKFLMEDKVKSVHHTTTPKRLKTLIEEFVVGTM